MTFIYLITCFVDSQNLSFLSALALSNLNKRKEKNKSDPSLGLLTGKVETAKAVVKG